MCCFLLTFMFPSNTPVGLLQLPAAQFGSPAKIFKPSNSNKVYNITYIRCLKVNKFLWSGVCRN